MITNSAQDGVSSREHLALKAKALTTTGAQQSQLHPHPNTTVFLWLVNQADKQLS